MINTKDTKNQELKQYKCNMCGKIIEKGKDFAYVKDWGYYSNKDLERHSFNLCEKCYDELVNKFVIPVGVVEIDCLGRVTDYVI